MNRQRLDSDTASRPGRLAQALGELARREPVRVRVSGGCMAPLVADGSEIALRARRVYLPGDVVALRSTAGGLLLHRVLGYRWSRRQGLRLVTAADRVPTGAAHRVDGPVPLARVIGRLIARSDGPAEVRMPRIPIAHRLRAVGGWCRWGARALSRRAAARLARGRGR